MPPQKKIKTPRVKAPKIKKEIKIYHFDARGKVLGRLASEVAQILRGKNLASFRPYRLPENIVEIENASKIKITGRKLEQKQYYRHSGYLGNLKSSNLKDVLAKDPVFVLKNAIKGMIPKNKLQDQMLKKLKIYPGVKDERS